MKRKISISTLLSVALLILSLLIASLLNKPITTNTKPVNTHTSTMDEAYIEEEEMRGLWVSYLTLDMNSGDRSFEAFKEKFDKIVQDAQSLKCNTLIVQVRPFCDALYYSEYFPHSHILSGEQGVDPGYDALQYMCDTAHNNGMKIHAWVNPLRVKNSTSQFELSTENPYITNTNITLEVKSNAYLNPAIKSARQLIVDGVKEIVENYPVDGIQFDDYFYPADITDEDAESYNAYKNSVSSGDNAMSLQEWRENNINLLIAEVYRAIKSCNKDVLFGISPQGNIDNNKEIYADTTLWCETVGYVDYICPQLYYSVDNPTLAFEDALKMWQDISYHNKIKVYIGLGAYKAGTDQDDGTWLMRDTILKEELLLVRKYSFDGYMIYDYNAIVSDNAVRELDNLSDVI